jgi:hypothetical protein
VTPAFGPAVLPNGLLSDWFKRALRGKHSRAELPVAHCRCDQVNWPCDTIRALDALEAAEQIVVRVRAYALAPATHEVARDALLAILDGES